MFVQAQSTGVLSSLDPPPGGKLWANATEWPSYIGPSLIEPDHDDNQTEILGLNHQSLQIGHHLFTGSWGTSFIVVSGEKVPTILQKDLVLILCFFCPSVGFIRSPKNLVLIVRFLLAICCFHQIIQTFFQCEVRSSSTEHLFAAKIWRKKN